MPRAWQATPLRRVGGWYLGSLPNATMPLEPSESPAPDVTSLESVEARLREILAAEGVHVVHLWAPWCSNSRHEIEAGWADLIARHPEATFTFVTVWHDGGSGREVMEQRRLGDAIEELRLADLGPSENKELRHKTLLGLPLTWIPTTWIFRKQGTLAFALNYGEMTMPTLGELITASGRTW